MKRNTLWREEPEGETELIDDSQTRTMDDGPHEAETVNRVSHEPSPVINPIRGTLPRRYREAVRKSGCFWMKPV